MAFKTWQTGVHIQQDRVLIAALARERGGWCLRRWWAFTLAEGTIRDGKICQPEQLVNALRDWRKTLPHYHRVYLSFPAARTLQRSLPRPAVALRDGEQLSWLGASLSRELEMSADTLCFDYTQDTFSNTYHVTAAQNKEVETLLALAKTLHLWLATITPDASALANLLPAVAPTPCVAWRISINGCGPCATSGDVDTPLKQKTSLSWRRCWPSTRTTSRYLIPNRRHGKPCNAAMLLSPNAELTLPSRWHWL